MSRIPVSVLIPFYNKARFFEEAVASVLDQTFQDYELLLCDDGSTDGSTAIAQKYAQTYPDKIRYLQHPGHANLGQFSTRIFGARNARAPIIALLDHDDLWDRNYLELHLKIWNSVEYLGVYLSYGPYLQWFYENPDRSIDLIQPLPPEAPNVYPPGKLLDIFLSNDFAMTPLPSCSFIRKEVFEKLDKFEEAARDSLGFEDQYLWWYIASKWPVAIHNNVWVRWRQHRGSYLGLHGKGEQARNDQLKFIGSINGFLKETLPDHPFIKHGILQSKIDDLSRPLSGGKRFREILRKNLPIGIYMNLRSIYHTACTLKLHFPSLPVIRRLKCLQLRRLEPLRGGKQYGTPVVRYYWDHYLSMHQNDIRGKCLEIGTTATIHKYGGKSLIQADAIDLTKHSPEITVVADLSKADNIPSDTYDCFINQFSTAFIYDIESALYHSVRVLKESGVLLVNFPCLDYYFSRGLDMFTGPPIYMHWWYTPIMVENLLRRIGLTEKDYKLDIYGNLFSSIAYQMNMPAEELTKKELDFRDDGRPLLICVRVVKPQLWKTDKPSYREPWIPSVKPDQWNPVTGHYPLFNSKQRDSGKV
jgi:glycosyltransferase involved in cell wall biosynthesis